MPEETVIADARHEREDADGKFIAGAFFLVLGCLGFAGLICWGVFPWSTQDKVIPEPVISQYPQPRLQPDPHEDWRRFYVFEEERLNSFGWIDKGAGLVHIPIEQAMQEIARRGIDGWPAQQGH